MDTSDPNKTSEAGSQPARRRGLKPHQIMMLLLGALALFMIVGGVISVLEASRLPTPPARAAS